MKKEEETNDFEKKAIEIRNKSLNHQALSCENEIRSPLSVYKNKKERNQKIEEQKKKKKSFANSLRVYK